MKRLMTIFAHQDDETFSAGGVLAKYSELGEAISVSVTADKLRENEYKEACGHLGATALTLGHEMVDPSNRREIFNQMKELIVELKPDIVVTHVPFDYHHEHRLVNELVREAVEWASHTTSGTAHQVSSLWAAETTVLIPFPEIFIDISHQNERRMTAIECYESQSHKGGQGFYSEFHSARTHLRGIQAGVEHAEAFVSIPIARAGAFKPQKVFLEFPSS